LKKGDIAEYASLDRNRTQNALGPNSQYDNLRYPNKRDFIGGISMGATTIWERWDGQKTDSTFQSTGMNSFNHYAYGDRLSIDPINRQDEFLQKVKALGKPIIVVLKHRRTLSINEIAKSANAILDCWDMSEWGDEAIAKLIFGQANPSGKSPVTIPLHIGQLPIHYSQKEINYKKGYLFTENGLLYPFGFGLSYSKFEYSNLRLSTNIISPNSTLTATVTIRNTGNYTGKEMVQLYIKDIIGSVTRPDKELKSFQKIELKAGEVKDVGFVIKPEMLKFTTLKMVKELEAGDYQIMIGTSSQVGLKEKFKLVLK
jgi:beta-glucosidase